MTKPRATWVLAVALGASAPLAVAAEEWRVAFRGQPVFADASGLTVLHDDGRSLVMVSSTRHHFWLALPYAETWVFRTGDESILRATDGRLHVAIDARDATGDDAAALLRADVDRTRSSGTPAIRDVVWVDAFERPIVRYLVHDARAGRASTGGRRRVYRTAVPYDAGWYVLEVSLDLSATETPAEDDTPLLDILGDGFEADFGIDGKKGHR